MKRENRLQDMVTEGIKDTFLIWKGELKNVFADTGVMIFFFLVPFIYPLLYAFIYNNEVVREAKMVVVDQSNSSLSRKFIRMVDATADVKVVAACADMDEAKRMLDKKEAYGILLLPTQFSKDLHAGRQTNISLYSDMSSLLFYKAFLLSATEVSFQLGKEVRMHNHPVTTEKMESITVNPIPYESVTLFNTQNGFASFLVPAILILVIQQTLILGIGMLGGTARRRTASIRWYLSANILMERYALFLANRFRIWSCISLSADGRLWLCRSCLRCLSWLRLLHSPCLSCLICLPVSSFR